MSLKTKKENANPASNVLKNSTNVRSTRASKAKLKSPLKTQVSKENVLTNGQTKAGKPKKPKNLDPKSKKHVTEKPTAVSKPLHCFGFSDDDLETDIPPYNGELTAFDNSKPYRFALYVKPSKRIRVDHKLIQQVQCWSTLNLTNAALNLTAVQTNRRQASETIMSPDRTQWKVPFSSTPKETTKNQSKVVRTAPVKRPLVQKKITEILQPSPKRTRTANVDQQFTSYFESSVSSSTEEEAEKSVIQKSTKRKARNLTSREMEETSSDSAADAEPIENFRKPSRRSYIKKSRPAPEPEDTTPTEEILKSIEKTKTKKNKKKEQKEDEEFEKWSRSMNSMFSEVDQFEMSFD